MVLRAMWHEFVKVSIILIRPERVIPNMQYVQFSIPDLFGFLLPRIATINCDYSSTYLHLLKAMNLFQEENNMLSNHITIFS